MSIVFALVRIFGVRILQKCFVKLVIVYIYCQHNINKSKSQQDSNSRVFLKLDGVGERASIVLIELKFRCNLQDNAVKFV